MKTIIKEVIAERARQDEKWGGPEHDDKHTVWDFFRFMEAKINTVHMEFHNARNKEPVTAKRRLFQIAALAFAAIESIDRKSAEKSE